MRELQQVIASRDSTREQRDAARAELGRLMMGPGARGAPAIRNAPPRAAIDPFPSVVKPAAAAPASLLPPAAPGAAPDVARLERVAPPDRPGASAPPPIGRFVIDPRSGAVLHKTPAGYVDTRTGQLVPLAR